MKMLLKFLIAFAILCNLVACGGGGSSSSSSPVTYSISGKVSGLTSSGVLVTATPGGETATTDANGLYTMTGFSGNTTYTLRITKPGFVFSVADLSVPISTSNVSNADIFEPVPILTTGYILYPGFTDSYKATQGGLDGGAYLKQLGGGTETRLLGGFSYDLTAGSTTMYPNTVIRVRSATGKYIINSWNLPCMVGVFSTNLSASSYVTPVGVLAKGSFDFGQTGDVVALSQVFPGSPPQENIMLYRVDGTGTYIRVTNGPDVDSSPVFASGVNKFSTSAPLLFIRNDTEIMQMSVDISTSSLIGAPTIFASNVVNGVARGISVNGDFTQVAFMRKVGGITHIFTKLIAGGAEVDVVAGTDPYWATNRSSKLMYTADGKRFAINPDGTGKVEIPVPTNIGINGVEGAACGDLCLGNIVFY